MAELPEGQPLSSDTELIESKRRTMAFNIERIARYSVLIGGILFGLAVLIVVTYMLCTQESWREYAIQAVFNGLPAIILAFFVIVGIKNFGQKD